MDNKNNHLHTKTEDGTQTTTGAIIEKFLAERLALSPSVDIECLALTDTPAFQSNNNTKPFDATKNVENLGDNHVIHWRIETLNSEIEP